MSTISIHQLYEILSCTGIDDFKAINLIEDFVRNGNLKAYGFKEYEAEVKAIDQLYWQKGFLDPLQIMNLGSNYKALTYPSTDSAAYGNYIANTWKNLFFYKNEVEDLFLNEALNASSIKGNNEKGIAVWKGRFNREDGSIGFHKPVYEDRPEYLSLCQTLTWIAYGVVMDVDRYDDGICNLVLGLSDSDSDLKMVKAKEKLLNKLKINDLIALGIEGSEIIHKEIPVSYLINKRLEIVPWENSFCSKPDLELIFEDTPFPCWKEIQLPANLVFKLWESFEGKLTDIKGNLCFSFNSLPQIHQDFIEKAILIVGSWSEQTKTKWLRKTGINASIVSLRIQTKYYPEKKQSTIKTVLSQNRKYWDNSAK